MKTETFEEFAQRHFPGIEKEAWYPPIIAIGTGYIKYLQEQSATSIQPIKTPEEILSEVSGMPLGHIKELPVNVTATSAIDAIQSYHAQFINEWHPQIGEIALKRNSSDDMPEWEKFTINETYLALINEFPKDYKPLYHAQFEGKKEIPIFGNLPTGFEIKFVKSIMQQSGSATLLINPDDYDKIKRV